MSKLIVFNFITLNGYYKGPNEDTSWNRQGAEEGEYANEGSQSGGILLFGRITYEHMASFWPTPMAMESMPIVADGMNKSEKIVFSRTMKKADWNNTRVINGDLIEEVRKLKKTSGKDLCILGSGTISSQLAAHGLIDEYQFMLNPVALGDGTPIFKGIPNKLDLQLTSSRVFKTGVVLLCYRP